MNFRWKIPAALLAVSLAAAAVAQGAHHPTGVAPGSTTNQGGVAAGAMPGGHGMMGGAGMMRGMAGGMMLHMREMVTQRHGAPAADMSAMDHGDDSSMPGLDSLSGEEFEVAFMSMMTAHHQGAIAMADWVRPDAILEYADCPSLL